MTQRIGYARVSTDDQSTRSQADELAAAGCDTILTEHASGGDRARPILAKALETLKAGDTLVVVRIDRLARSLTHLLEVIERISAKKAFFRSLRDPIDTASPQGMFAFQVLGAAAQLERALIRERTRSALAAARRQGRVGGNPGLRRRDPESIRKIVEARRSGRLKKMAANDREWLDVVRGMRPALSWKKVVDALNEKQPAAGWTEKRLKSAVRIYIEEGFLDRDILRRAGGRRRAKPTKAYDFAIGAKLAQPDVTFAGIAALLEKSGIKTPSGAKTWTVSSVQKLIERARREGRL